MKKTTKKASSKFFEKATGESYSSKGSFKKHEKMESPMMKKAELKGAKKVTKKKGK